LLHLLNILLYRVYLVFYFIKALNVFLNLLLRLCYLYIHIFVHVANVILKLTFGRIPFWRWGRLLIIAAIKILCRSLAYHLRILADYIGGLRGCQLIIALKWLLFKLLVVNRSGSWSLAVLPFLFFVVFLNYLTGFNTLWNRKLTT
jgi:hypothetical protein